MPDPVPCRYLHLHRLRLVRLHLLLLLLLPLSLPRDRDPYLGHDHDPAHHARHLRDLLQTAGPASGFGC